jgi:hypothetical protein
MNERSRQPKPLRDIRYFESAEVPPAGAPMPRYASELFKLPKEAVALGQRVARKCEELGVSIGSADHLYVCFTPSLEEGALSFTDHAVEPWHRFVLCGLDRGFNERSAQEQLQAVCGATFDAIAALAQAGADQLPSLQRDVVAKGDALRVTLRTKQTKKYRVAVEQTVLVPPSPSQVFVRVEEIGTSKVLEVQVAEVRFHDDAPALVDRLAIVDEVLVIHPRKSFRAELVQRKYEVPLRVSLRGRFDATEPSTCL